MNILDYVNSLKTPERFQAVSFEAHCDIGFILDQDDGSEDSQEVLERTLRHPDEIKFMP